MRTRMSTMGSLGVSTMLIEKKILIGKTSILEYKKLIYEWKVIKQFLSKQSVTLHLIHCHRALK